MILMALHTVSVNQSDLTQWAKQAVQTKQKPHRTCYLLNGIAGCREAFIHVNSAKKEMSLFQDTVFQRSFVKIQITSQIFIVKGLNKVSHACSMNRKQLMNMHLWNGRQDSNNLQTVGNKGHSYENLGHY